jgi:hypothetical protein
METRKKRLKFLERELLRALRSVQNLQRWDADWSYEHMMAELAQELSRVQRELKHERDEVHG